MRKTSYAYKLFLLALVGSLMKEKEKGKNKSGDKK